MGNEQFDANTHFAFWIRLFKSYRKTGLLQAELHHIPGHCQGDVLLVEGRVSPCSVEEVNDRPPRSKQTLIGVDEKRGAFDWCLQPLSVPLSPALSGSFSSWKEKEPLSHPSKGSPGSNWIN